MIDNLIISREDIESQYKMSKNIDQSRIDTEILRAQRFDLLPIIGSHMYNALINGLDTTPIIDKWNELMDGKEYNANGRQVYFFGIKSTLCAFAYARILDAGKLNVTRSGNVEKVTPESQQVEKETQSYVVTSVLSDAVQYADGLKLFLINNTSTYTEYELSNDRDTGRKASIQFFNASRRK